MDIPERFWKKWIKLNDEAEFEKRDKHLEPIFKAFEDIFTIPDRNIKGNKRKINLRKFTFMTALNGYLEDFRA